MRWFRLDVLLPVGCLGLLVWGFAHRAGGDRGEAPEKVVRPAWSRGHRSFAPTVSSQSPARQGSSRAAASRVQPSSVPAEADGADSVAPEAITDSAWVAERYPAAFQLTELSPLSEPAAICDGCDDTALIQSQARLVEVLPDAQAALASDEN